MKRIWEAVVLWFVALFAVKEPEEIEPGTCMCGHLRCSHRNGKYKCMGEFPPVENSKHEWEKTWRGCSCVIYIDDKDDNDEPEVPTPEDLEKLYSR